MVFFRYEDIPGRDRQGRHALRRERRQHREHGRVEDPRRAAGADGAVGRHAAVGGADRRDAQRRLRRRASSSSSASAIRTMGERGAGWVVAQFVLMAAVIAAGFVPPDWPQGAQVRSPWSAPSLAIGGLVFAVWAGRTMGRSLTPFPKPVEAGLVTRRALRDRPAPDLHGRPRSLPRATRCSRACRRSSSRSLSGSSGRARFASRSAISSRCTPTTRHTRRACRTG